MDKDYTVEFIRNTLRGVFSEGLPPGVVIDTSPGSVEDQAIGKFCDGRAAISEVAPGIVRYRSKEAEGAHSAVG